VSKHCVYQVCLHPSLPGGSTIVARGCIIPKRNEAILRNHLSHLTEAWITIPPTIDNDDSPRENGYIESFDGKMGYELLIREIFFNLEEAKILITRC
jgi:hypothetical protein